MYPVGNTFGRILAPWESGLTVNSPEDYEPVGMTTEGRYRRRDVLATGLGIAATGLAGCLGRGDEDDGLPDRVEVTMRSEPFPEYDPIIAHVGVGGTVVWVLESGTHDTTAYHPDTHPPLRIPPDAAPWQSEKYTSVGESFEHTFETPGVYDYVDTEAVCISHEVAGNVGRVIVGWPDPDPAEQPALQPPQETLPSVARKTIRDLNEETFEILSSRDQS